MASYTGEDRQTSVPGSHPPTCQAITTMAGSISLDAPMIQVAPNAVSKPAAVRTGDPSRAHRAVVQHPTRP